jgi:GMP synthase (glutamine-hydrolysing)
MILIIDCGSKKTPYIEEAVDLQMDFKTLGINDFLEKDLDGIKGVIVSGAPILVTEIDMEPFMNRMKVLKETHLPVLGICFGHQLLGLLHGAYASRQKEDRDWQEIEVLEDCPLFDKLPSQFEMMEDHCESISVPKGFKLVATSDACVNEAMMHLEKPLYGVQFHPEVSGNLGTTLIENFVDICIKQGQQDLI